jgi:hypothetical protein
MGTLIATVLLEYSTCNWNTVLWKNCVAVSPCGCLLYWSTGLLFGPHADGESYYRWKQTMMFNL